MVQPGSVQNVVSSTLESNPGDNGVKNIDPAPIASASDPGFLETNFQSDRLENHSGVSESDEKSVHTDNKKPAARKHNTRGQNGIKKQRIEVSLLT
jgi:hypothetical protein